MTKQELEEITSKHETDLANFWSAKRDELQQQFPECANYLEWVNGVFKITVLGRFPE